MKFYVTEHRHQQAQGLLHTEPNIKENEDSNKQNNYHPPKKDVTLLSTLTREKEKKEEEKTNLVSLSGEAGNTDWI